MKSFIVAHFRNGVIIETKRKPKADIPQPLTLKVAGNAVKRLNKALAKPSFQDYWAYLTIDQYAKARAKEWASHRATVGNE